jgi:hypothetical protein
MNRQLFDRVQFMGLNKESRYFCTYLQDHFFSDGNNGVKSKACLKWDLYSAASLLLACKFREVDNKIPYASEIKRFHDNFW